MDPLSIATAAITLIQATGAITASLGGMLMSLKTADTCIDGLCDELARLKAYLEAVQDTLQGCRAFDMACVDGDLWRQSELALMDCHATLGELSVLVGKIKTNARSRGFGWRARAVLDLTVYGADITAFRDKIHKSNWALQTILHTINVSLSLRNNASQETILFKLEQLKSSINEALHVSLYSAGGFCQGLSSDFRVARNLRNLAEAAKNFHSAASSTASTVRDGSIAPWDPHAGHPISLLGDIPTYRRERVETFIRDAQQQSHERQIANKVGTPPTLSVASPRPVPTAALPRTTIPTSNETFTEEDDDEDEAEFERLFLDSLEDLAKDSMKSQDFSKAIELLKEAIRREEQVSAPGNQHLYRLQVQLALNHLFQGSWRQAESVVAVLAKSKAHLDLLVCNMLHAISLAHLNIYCFDQATKLAKQALQGKRRWFKANGLTWQDTTEYGETLGLLGTILEMTGDYIGAEIYRNQLPPGFIYNHPSSRHEFIAGHCSLLRELLGEDLPDLDGSAKDPSAFHELEAVTSAQQQAPLGLPANQKIRRSRTVSDGNTSPLRAKRCEWERFESDTLKEVVSTTAVVPDSVGDADADDEASTVEPPAKRRLARIFSTVKGQTRRRDLSTEPTFCKPRKSPIARLFKPGSFFGPRHSKSALRDRENEGDLFNKSEKPLRLLHMRRINLDDVSEKSPRKDATPELNSRRDAESNPPVNFETPQPVAIYSLSLATRPVSVDISGPSIQQPIIAELPQDPATHSRTHRSQRPESSTLLPLLREYSLLLPHSSAHVKNSTLEGGTSYLALPSGEDPEITSFEASIAMLAGLNSEDHETEPWSWSTVRNLSQARNPPAFAQPTVETDRSKDTKASLFSYSRAATNSTISDRDIEATTPSSTSKPSLSHLAEVIASLNRMDDTEELHAAKLQLETIVLQIGPVSNDPVLMYDVQRIIRSLDGRKTHCIDGNIASDSGYETMSLRSTSLGLQGEKNSSDASICTDTKTQTTTGAAARRRSTKRRRTPTMRLDASLPTTSSREPPADYPPGDGPRWPAQIREDVSPMSRSPKEAIRAMDTDAVGDPIVWQNITGQCEEKD